MLGFRGRKLRRSPYLHSGHPESSVPDQAGSGNPLRDSGASCVSRFMQVYFSICQMWLEEPAPVPPLGSWEFCCWNHSGTYIGQKRCTVSLGILTPTQGDRDSKHILLSYSNTGKVENWLLLNSVGPVLEVFIRCHRLPLLVSILSSLKGFLNVSKILVRISESFFGPLM